MNTKASQLPRVPCISNSPPTLRLFYPWPCFDSSPLPYWLRVTARPLPDSGGRRRYRYDPAGYPFRNRVRDDDANGSGSRSCIFGEDRLNGFQFGG